MIIYKTGLAFIAGTYIECTAIWYLQFLQREKISKSYIDELILFEQRVNTLNGLFILLQMLAIIIPATTFRNIAANYVFCIITEVLLSLPIIHRAIGGVGIAGIRQVPI